MTVATTTNKAIGTGNGVSTTFPFTFGTLATGDLVVSLFDLNGVEIPQVENTDYTVLGEGSDDGGAVVFAVAPPSGYTVQIIRIIPVTQPTDLKNQGSYYPRTVERMSDRSCMIDQQFQEQLDRSIKIPSRFIGVNTDLPEPEPSTFFGWNETATGIRNFPLSDLATNIAYGSKVWQTFTGDGTTKNFMLIRDPASLGNLDISIDGVTQVPVTDYTYAATTLTFVTAPVNGSVILVRYDTALPIGSADSASTLFIQSGDGAVPRSSQDKMRERISVTDFGAVGDGVTDDTAAFIKAIARAAYRTLYIPAGRYKVSPITIPKSMIVEGDGPGLGEAGDFGSVIYTASDTSNVFTVDTTAEVTFRDFAIASTGAPTAGAGIILTETTPTLGVGNLFSSIQNVRFENMFIGVDAQAASSFTISGCTFWNIRPNGMGIRLDNTINDDQGDQNIIGNTFMAAASALTALGISWIGGGGTRIVSNKFLMNRSILANLATAQQTAQLIIADNSFDANQGADAAAVQCSLQMVSGTLPFNNIVLQGNQFISYFAINAGLQVAGLPAAKVGQVNIQGNNIVNTLSAAFSGGPIQIDNVTDFLIQGNLIIGNGSATGIAVGSACSNGSVEHNRIRGFTNSVVNSAAANGVTQKLRTNSGATGSVSDGGAITHNLGVAPSKVRISGNVAAQTYVPFGITSTQFQVAVRNTAGASGSAATIYWEVEE